VFRETNVRERLNTLLIETSQYFKGESELTHDKSLRMSVTQQFSYL